MAKINILNEQINKSKCIDRDKEINELNVKTNILKKNLETFKKENSDLNNKIKAHEDRINVLEENLKGIKKENSESKNIINLVDYSYLINKRYNYQNIEKQQYQIINLTENKNNQNLVVNPGELVFIFKIECNRYRFFSISNPPNQTQIVLHNNSIYYMFKRNNLTNEEMESTRVIFRLKNNNKLLLELVVTNNDTSIHELIIYKNIFNVNLI